MFIKQLKHHIFYLVKWVIVLLPVAIMVGSLVALFLWLLTFITLFRWQHQWLLYLLPVAGVGIVTLYRYFGREAEKGNNLIIDEVVTPRKGVPLVMAPLVLVTTVATHLFGGSAGREGTAVQIGGSIASYFSKLFKLASSNKQTMLMGGIAAGFGAVFGTPIAGAVFAIEVHIIGKLQYNSIVPCLIASFMGSWVCNFYGLAHTQYIVNDITSGYNIWGALNVNWQLLLWASAAGVLFGLSGALFSTLAHGVKNLSNKYIKQPLLIPFIGGVLVVALAWGMGSSDYLGLGVTTANGEGTSIVNAFTNHDVDDWGWLWKTIFTVITLGMGFKGGEVTPLFFVGATLGNSFAMFAGLPVDLFAAIGFVAVFAAATNAPVASAIMAIELFSGHNALYYLVGCVVAYFFSGLSGIYSSQKLGTLKRLRNQNLHLHTTISTAVKLRRKRFLR